MLNLFCLSARPVRLLALGASLAAFTWAGPATAMIDPVALYGSGLEFDILRNGRPVGTHSVTFDPAPDGTLAVTARSDIAVRVLVFTAYRFSYESRSVWRDGRLERLSVRTDDAGTVSSVAAQPGNGGLDVRGPEGTTRAPADIFPTDHWNPDVRGASRVLNTITGRLNAVTMTAEATELVPTADGPRPAQRWRYEGELETVAWYDAAGRWVGLRFEGSDGSVVDYVCRRCGGAAP